MVAFLKNLWREKHVRWKVFRIGNIAFHHRGIPVCWCFHNAGPVIRMGCLDTDGYWWAFHTHWNCFVGNQEIKGGEKKMIALILGILLIIAGAILLSPWTLKNIPPIPLRISSGACILLGVALVLYHEGLFITG